ncbi:MAG: DNA repair protein RecN [Bacteroidales bacterium]|jgi:DNA repair protein RecN (Recombination protein N)|nr:DNA repair protein RecN [Bacteroidales bacterium]
MVKHLTIENYALIDHLDIDFYQGFTAITGETGAGKSILVDALDLVLGKRADTQVLLDPDRKCVVEATFSIADYNLEHRFREAGMEYDDLTILRREIHPTGKSRAFVNDTPVTLNQLKVLGDLLVDIHAQHSTSSLQDTGFQLSVVDSFAGLESEIAYYQKQFMDLKNARVTLKDLVQKEANARSTLDFKQFQLNELETAELKPDEQDQLEEILTLITHAEEIKAALFQVRGILGEDENSILNLLSQAEGSLNRIAAFHPGLEKLTERFRSDIIDLKDIHVELVHLDDSIDVNQEQLASVQERLDLIYRLQQKHHVNSISDLLAIRASLSSELNAFTSLENQIKVLEDRIKSMQADLEASAGRLSEKRKAAFPFLEKQIIASLKHMGIPEALFEIRQEIAPEYHMEGYDRIEFHFNANKGHSLKPLSEIASGGELSRVMLSIKSIISNRKLLPTIIFDEIDNGLSGDIAGRVGEVLFTSSKRMQVIVVTHLPQIAGKAQHHYSVYKQNKNNVTFSNIKFLDHQERITELAKMIGGREITVASVAAARELLTSSPEIL